MPLDIYSTRAQLAAIEQMPRVYSFLFDTFCRDGGVVEDDKAIWDFRKGSQKMAPVVVPGTGGVPMLRGTYETREIGFCTIAPERVVENNDLKGRMFGERVLGALTPQERERRMMNRDLTEMRQAIQRRIEWMTRQVVLTGNLSVFRYVNEGREISPSLIANYGFTNVYTPTTPWNQAGADVDGDMKAMFDLVYNGTGYVDIILMAPDAAAAMLNNSAFMKFYDYKNVDMGEINTRYRGAGVRYIGTNADGVDMFSLSGSFLDDDGQMKPMLPSGTVIAGSRGMLNALYGPVTQVESEGMDSHHITYMKKQVPLRYGSIQTGAVKQRLTSCPTIVPFNVDAWAVADVL